MILLDAMRGAPVVGIDDPSNSTGPDVVCHAVGIDALIDAWPEGPAVGVCGAGGLRLLRLSPEGDGGACPWPPRLASMPAGWARCRPCYVADGKRRPRCEFRSRA
ncbi:MAG: hypothetical protein LC792_22430 [Actinobacteria bacterium]|nr:hypothetical protein [Actinomycetota bacterium]